jgi:hypothetical protein
LTTARAIMGPLVLMPSGHHLPICWLDKYFALDSFVIGKLINRIRRPNLDAMCISWMER